MDTGAQYTGEKIPGDLDGFAHFSNDPNGFLAWTYGLLSKRSTTLYHTFGPVTSAIDKQTDYAIGDGLFFRSQPDWRFLGIDKAYAADWARDFQNLIHYEFLRLNFYQKQNVLFRTGLTQGDSLLYFLRDESGFDLIDFPGSTINFEAGGKVGELVTLGIVHDAFYRKQGFYDTSGNKVSFKENGRQNVVQFYNKKLSRQLRGYPLAYTCISVAKNLDRFYDATLQTAIAESMFVAFTSSDDPGSDARQIENQAKESRGIVRSIATALERIGNTRSMGAGNMLNFKTGGKLTTVDKKTPGNSFGPFNDAMIDVVGMGTDTPPEVIKSKYGTSFTAHKGALNDFQKSFMQKRAVFADVVCHPVVREIATNLILSGAISAPGFIGGSDANQRAWLKGIWLGPVPGTINPLQEVNAKLSAIKGGLSLRSSEAFQSNGGEYADFMEQWEQEESQYQKMYPDAQANKLAESFESGESSKPVPDEDAEDKPEETDDKESKNAEGDE